MKIKKKPVQLELNVVQYVPKKVNVITGKDGYPGFLPGSTEDMNIVVPVGSTVLSYGNRGKPLTKKEKTKVIYSGYDTQFWNLERDGITQSAIAAFVQCPQKAEYKLKHGFSLEGMNHKLDFGTIFHEVLDKVYSTRLRNINNTKPYTKYLWKELCNNTVSNYYDDHIEDVDPADLRKFELCIGQTKLVLEHYFEWWSKKDSTANIIAVEKEFSFPYKLRSGVNIVFRGKMDRIDKVNKDIWLFETKTKDDIEPTTSGMTVNGIVEKMDYELQVMVYCLAIKELYGVYPKGVIYNLVKRPQQEFKGSYRSKSETLPQYFDRVHEDIIYKSNISTREHEYFMRYEIALFPEKIEEWKLRDLDYIIERIAEWSDKGYGSYRNSANCAMYRKPCEFLSICSLGETSRYKVREKIFPELDE